MPPAAAPAAPAPAVPAVPTTAAPKAPAPAPGAPPAAAPEQFFEVKVDGQPKKYTRAEAEKLLSKAGYADKVIQQSKEAIRAAQEAKTKAEQSAAERLQRAKERTEDFLREHGIDPDEFARQRLEKKVEEGKLTPDQKRALEAERKAQELADKLAAQEKEREAEGIKARTTQIQRHIETTLAQAAKRAGIEPGDTSFAAIHAALKEAWDLGLLPEDGMIAPHHADVIVDEAKANIEGQFGRLEKAVLNGLTGEALLKRVGDKVALEVSKALVARVRGSGSATAPAPGAPPPAPPPPPAEPQPTGYLSEAEVDKKLRKLGGR